MSPHGFAILRWSLLALLGLIAAVAVGIAGASLTSSRIGISSEPIQAGEALAPKSAKREERHGSGGHRRADSDHGTSDDPAITDETSSTVPPATTAAPPTVTGPPTTTTPSASDDSADSEGGDD
jgi:hypothetical protein